MMRIFDTFPDPTFDPPQTGAQTIVLGGGCFWCTEGVFRTMNGVTNVRPGYAGGDPARATYEEVCKKDTGHYEVIEITYDAAAVSLGAILKAFFWLAHDPTQADGQGYDIGPQYRSVIFYADETQHEVARQYMTLIEDSKIFDAPLATNLIPLDQFFVAEAYHHNYAASHAQEPYIKGVALPKIERASTLGNH